jgi:cysteine desulfurase/selenocysteine lyase
MGETAAYEDQPTFRALELLGEIPGVRIVGPRAATDRGSAVSFAVDGIHPHDVGQVLDERGLAVRVGRHRARPIVRRYGVPAITRPRSTSTTHRQRWTRQPAASVPRRPAPEGDAHSGA